MKEYVNHKYETETLQMEFAYNFIDGLDRFKELPHIGMFKDVLEKNKCEQMFERYLDNITRIRKACWKKMQEIQRKKNVAKTYLKDSQFKSILQERFMEKSDFEIEHLVNIAIKETKDEFEDPEEEVVKKIFVDKLFANIFNGDFGNFAQSTISQEVAAKQQLVDNIIAQVNEWATNSNEWKEAKKQHEGTSEGKKVAKDMIKDAIKSACPNVSDQQIKMYVSLIFPNEQYLPVQEVKKRLVYHDIV